MGCKFKVCRTFDYVTPSKIWGSEPGYFSHLDGWYLLFISPSLRKVYKEYFCFAGSLPWAIFLNSAGITFITVAFL